MILFTGRDKRKTDTHEKKGIERVYCYFFLREQASLDRFKGSLFSPWVTLTGVSRGQCQLSDLGPASIGELRKEKKKKKRRKKKDTAIVALMHTETDHTCRQISIYA